MTKPELRAAIRYLRRRQVNSAYKAGHGYGQGEDLMPEQYAPPGLHKRASERAVGTEKRRRRYYVRLYHRLHSYFAAAESIRAGESIAQPELAAEEDDHGGV